MSCKECRELMYEYVDGSLSQERKQEISAHLKVCRECREVYEEEARISAFLKEAMVRRTSSLEIDQSVFLRMKEKKQRKKSPVFGWRWADLLSKPVTIVIVAMMIFLSIFVFHSLKSDQQTISWLKNRAADFDLEEDMMMSDPRSDWLERRLIIIIVDKKQKRYGKIFTSKFPDKTTMVWEKMEAQ